jgi:8-oxo-dGTP pyrophosphatase MutT (NUDIX family)
VLLDDEDRVLMLKIHDPSATQGPNPITADFWLLVGGGVEPGETYEQAAYREVVEETGIRAVSIGRCVWTQEKLVTDPAGELQMVIGRYFVGRVGSATAVSFDGHEPFEAATTVGYHWFTREEIVAREAEETFLPPGLGTLLADVLGGAAGDPVSLTA